MLAAAAVGDTDVREEVDCRAAAFGAGQEVHVAVAAELRQAGLAVVLDVRSHSFHERLAVAGSAAESDHRWRPSEPVLPASSAAVLNADDWDGRGACVGDAFGRGAFVLAVADDLALAPAQSRSSGNEDG